MGKLIILMLSISDSFKLDSDLFEEQVSSVDVISEGLVFNNSLFNSSSDGHFFVLDSILLMLLGVNVDLVAGEFGQFGVGTLIGVNKVFNFSQSKFSQSDDTRLGSNFVSVSLSDLGTSEGDSSSIVIKELLEIDKHALGSLWSQVSLRITSGSDLDSKHKIEMDGFSEIISSLGTFDLVLLNDFSHLFLGVGFDMTNDFFVLLLLFFGELIPFLFDEIFKVFLDQVVASVEDISLLGVLNHDIIELLNVSRSDQNFFRGDTSCLNFHQIIFNDKVFSPELLNICLDGRSWWSIVVETSLSSVNRKGWNDIISSLEKIVESVSFLGQSLL
mmetsp:Transcript_5090/g.4295  ORF Transcript_5090/g.4295 Transcript_5090/m.4295 type:complete len:330 (+) Transcript_5090:483-1472(+)